MPRPEKPEDVSCLNGTVNYLSRFLQDENEFETMNMKYLPVLEERLPQIQQDTKADDSLQVLKAVIQKGWPEHKSNVPSVISPYFNMRDEMLIQDGLIFKGECVVVPRASRSELFKPPSWG